MSIIPGGSRWIAAVRCDGCGAMCRFGPLAVKRAVEARQEANKQHGWNCWDPTPKVGEPVVPVELRDKDYCDACGPGGRAEFV